MGPAFKIQTVVHFIYSLKEELTSVQYCAKHLDISDKMTRVEWNNYHDLGGSGKIVEIYENLIL